MSYIDKFKTFKGTSIDNIIDYLYNAWKEEPSLTLSIGTDSKQSGVTTTYVTCIMLYNETLKKGAHVLYYKESFVRILDTFDRLYKETSLTLDIVNELEPLLLEKGYVREDLKNEFLYKKYKYQLEREKGNYDYVPVSQEDIVIQSILLTLSDKREFNLFDIHCDYSYKELDDNKCSNRRYRYKVNKSYNAYQSALPMLRGMNYIAYPKPFSYAASSAADFILHF